MTSGSEMVSLRKKDETNEEEHILPWAKDSFNLDLKKTFGNLIIIALLLILTSRMVAYAGGEKLASPVAVVSSDSMEPTMNVGDMVFWSPATIESVSENDIIVFRSDSHEEELVTHRVIEVRENNGQTELITKGDNNENPDPSPVTQSELLGKIVGVNNAPLKLPFVGHIWLSLTTTLGVILANIGGPEMLMGVPLVTAVMMIILILALSPDEDNSELADLVLRGREQKIDFLKMFVVLLIAFSLVILPSLFYGSDTKEISIGVGEEAGPGDETFSHVRPGQEINGNQTVSNQGALSSRLYIKSGGEAGDWTRFEKSYVKVERRSDKKISYTVYVPEDAEQGQYTAEIQNQNSAHWAMYPDGFVINVMDTYPEHGPLYLALLTILLLASLSLATIIILSFLFREFITWRRYRNAKKQLSDSDPQNKYIRRMKGMTSWLAGIGRIDFDLQLPLKAAAISLLIFPLALFGAGLWLLPLMVVLSVLITLHLGGRWRGEIHTAALISAAVTITGVYLFPLLFEVQMTLYNGLPLILLAISVSIFILLLLSPLILLLSHLTAVALKRYSSLDPDITDI